jgi:hypothetical protein
MANKIKKTTGAPVNQILFATQPSMAVSIQLTNTGITADSDGKKIIKAGTPIKGSFEARGTAWTKATGADTVAIALHDVDVTEGAENATALIFGFVDINKIDATTAELITEDVKTALKGGITFLK